MKKLVMIIFILLIPSISFAARLHPKSTYQSAWCRNAAGVVEYALPDKTRVDCLTNDYAIEFYYADQWGEAIGQAMYYANQTGRHPGVVLISERGEDDYKYLFRFLKAIEDSPKQWRLWIVEPDPFFLEKFPQIPSLTIPIP